MADSWRMRQSVQRRNKNSKDSQFPGNFDGRIRQAAPLPARTDIEPEAGGGGGAVWVAPQAEPPPDVVAYPLWFVTDEPV